MTKYGLIARIRRFLWKQERSDCQILLKKGCVEFMGIYIGEKSVMREINPPRFPKFFGPCQLPFTDCKEVFMRILP